MQGAPPPFHGEPTLKCPLYYVSIIIRGSTIRGFTVLHVRRDSRNFEAAHLKKERRKQTWSLDDFQVPYFHNAVLEPLGVLMVNYCYKGSYIYRFEI